MIVCLHLRQGVQGHARSHRTRMARNGLGHHTYTHMGRVAWYPVACADPISTELQALQSPDGIAGG